LGLVDRIEIVVYQDYVSALLPKGTGDPSADLAGPPDDDPHLVQPEDPCDITVTIDKIYRIIPLLGSQ